jgi:hypothetical protein
MISDTPRTDAETYVWQNGGENPFVHRNFARQLERELNASKAEVERLHDYIKRVLLLLDSDLPTKETAKFWDEYESQYGKIQ